ncbi:MAG TPA: SGNH/GDSL hydrolase family protein, partial [Candidatus Saccharimonas sp.]|nr:SGNH/GDSL hydrolase family protein [Candidatus Saccharimonas sp.]
IMNGGGNDFCCGNSQDPVRVEGYMQQWIDLIWSTEPSAYIIVLGLTGNYHPEYDSWIQTYAATLKSQGKHIDYVYIEDVTTNDTVHPDNPGYQTITDRMVPEIKPFMQALTGH